MSYMISIVVSYALFLKNATKQCFLSPKVIDKPRKTFKIDSFILKFDLNTYTYGYYA